MVAWARGAYAAEASLNWHLHKHLSALTADWFVAWRLAPAESAHLRFDWGDEPLNPPCFAVAHLETEADTPGLGYSRHAGAAGTGYPVAHLTEISCWHTRYWSPTSPNPAWAAQLRQMADMVRRVFASAPQAPLLDLDSATAHPFVTAGLIRFRGIREVATPPDPNPALVRRRILLSWTHLETT